MAKFVIQSHGRLQEWIAEEHGYFAEESRGSGGYADSVVSGVAAE